eukprot:g58877.t1
MDLKKWQDLQQQLDETNARLESTLRSQDALAISWALSTGFSIFFMQTGFTLLEVGALREASIRHILLKNITALTLVAVCWIPIGYCLAYCTGGSNMTFQQCFNAPFSSFPFDMPVALLFQTFGLAALCTSVATGAVAERFALRGYLLTSILIPLLVFPVVVSWSWTEYGLLREMGFHDRAGSAVVHITGGMLGLVAAWRVGARFGRFTFLPIPDRQNFDPQTGENRPMMRRQALDNFPGKSSALQLAGVLCIWFSWYSVNCTMANTSVAATSDYGSTGPQIVLVTTICAAYAGMADLAWQALLNRCRVRRGQSKQLFAVDGISSSVLTGLVASSAGCDVASYWHAAMVGLVAMCIRRSMTHLLLLRGVDDPLQVSSVHFGGGLWGVLAVGIYHPTRGLLHAGRSFFVAQFLGGLAVTAFAATIGLVVFNLLHFLDQRCSSVRWLRRDFKKESHNHKEEKFRQNMKDLVKATVYLFSEPDEVEDHVLQKMGFHPQAAREWREFVINAYTDLPPLLDSHRIHKSEFCTTRCTNCSSSLSMGPMEEESAAFYKRLQQAGYNQDPTSSHRASPEFDNKGLNLGKVVNANKDMSRFPKSARVAEQRSSLETIEKVNQDIPCNRHTPMLGLEQMVSVSQGIPSHRMSTSPSHLADIHKHSLESPSHQSGGRSQRHSPQPSPHDLSPQVLDFLDMPEYLSGHNSINHSPAIGSRQVAEGMLMPQLLTALAAESLTLQDRAERNNIIDPQQQFDAKLHEDSLQSQISQLNANSLERLQSSLGMPGAGPQYAQANSITGSNASSHERRAPSLKDLAFVDMQSEAKDVAFVDMISQPVESEYFSEDVQSDVTETGSNYQDAVSDVPDSEFVRRSKGVFDGSMPYLPSYHEDKDHRNAPSSFGGSNLKASGVPLVHDQGHSVDIDHILSPMMSSPLQEPAAAHFPSLFPTKSKLREGSDACPPALSEFFCANKER